MRRTLRSARHLRLVEILVEARRAAGLTQGELAKQLGRPQSVLSSLESGGRRIDVIELLEIAELIDLDLHRLLEELASTPT